MNILNPQITKLEPVDKYDPWRNLASAIVVQAVEDIRTLAEAGLVENWKTTTKCREMFRQGANSKRIRKIGYSSVHEIEGAIRFFYSEWCLELIRSIGLNVTPSRLRGSIFPNWPDASNN